MKKKFDYGNFLLEYRTSKDGELRFLKKRIIELDIALSEAAKLRDLGYHGVKITKNN